jgi:ABC-type polysaccharide/polyol phosphate transport system ATPase subunit
MTDQLIVLSQVGVRYELRERHSVIQRVFHSKDKNPLSYIDALSGIDLKVSPGDRIGVIGLNGAGKTTLLKVMSGILPPTSGSAVIENQVTAILNTNLGMDLNLTGRENTIIRGMLLGLSLGEAKSTVDIFSEWTELGNRIDSPIVTYSDGMRARLAFAINTYVPSKILVIDEGIGAGDAAFQEKAKLRLNQFFKQSTAIILASHSLDFLKSFANKLVLLDKGRVIMVDNFETVNAAYQEILENQRSN